DKAIKKRQHSRVAGRFCEILQEAKWTEEAVDFLIVENDPSHRFKFLILILRFELAAKAGEVGQNYARLGKLLPPMDKNWRFAHLVDVGPELRCALNHSAEKINPYRLPIGSHKIKHQRRAIGIAGLGEAIKLKLRH